MEETISLKEIIHFLKKRLALIVGVTLIAVVLSAIFTFFLTTPQYQASTQILVNQTQENEQPINATELQSNRELINTYNVIMTSPIILDSVIEETGIDRGVNELQGQITVSSEEESQVVTLSVEDSNPALASDLANTIAQTFEEEVIDIMNIDNVSILSNSQAEDVTNPISPQPLLNLMVSFIIGLMIGVGLALLLEFMDQTVKTEQDVEKLLNLPILGSISIIDQDIENNKTNETRSNKSLRNNNDSEKKSRKTS